MDTQKSIFIFEYLSSGGFSDEDVPIMLLSEGFGILTSLITDFSNLGFKVNLLIDIRLSTQIESLTSSLKHEKENKYISKLAIDYNLVNNKNELDLNFDSFVEKSDYCMIIAPEFNKILLDYVIRAEKIANKFGGEILNPSSQFIKIFSDKVESERYFKENQNTPVTYTINDFKINYKTYINTAIEKADQEKSNLHYIIKPNDGVGCVDTFEIYIDLNSCNKFTHTLFEDLLVALSFIESEYPQSNYIIQEKFDGVPLSISIINRKGKMVFFSVNEQIMQNNIIKKINQNVAIRKIDYIGGNSPYTKLPKEIVDTLKKISKKLCKIHKFNGFFGVDFIFNDRKLNSGNKNDSFSLIEINPRVTTPYIAYSGIYRKENKNLSELFFSGNYLNDSDYMQFSCNYTKSSEKSGINGDSMKIEYFPIKNSSK